MLRATRAISRLGLRLALLFLAGALTPAIALAQADIETEDAATGTTVQPLAVEPGLPAGADDSDAGAEPTQGPQSETFQYPVYNGYRLNFCYQPAEDQCGQPAAEKWCHAMGFAKVASWTRDPHVGALFPTIFMGWDALCDKFLCDGFEKITCTQ